MKSKNISCGIILLNKQKEILLCEITPTPSNEWLKNKFDLPKGKNEPQETPLETTIRELYEETSISLTQKHISQIIDLNEHSYNKFKNLHLFLLIDHNDEILNSNNLTQLQCLSTFEDIDGKIYKEIKDFKLFPLKELFLQADLIKEQKTSFLNKSMAFLFKKLEKDLEKFL